MTEFIFVIIYLQGWKNGGIKIDDLSKKVIIVGECHDKNPANCPQREIKKTDKSSKVVCLTCKATIADDRVAALGDIPIISESNIYFIG